MQQARLLDHVEVRHPVQQLADDAGELHLGEIRTEAEVLADPEGQVRIGVARDVETLYASAKQRLDRELRKARKAGMPESMAERAIQAGTGFSPNDTVDSFAVPETPGSPGAPTQAASPTQRHFVSTTLIGG